jgi:tetratricopeptide (TPR) repeat protein
LTSTNEQAGGSGLESEEKSVSPENTLIAQLLASKRFAEAHSKIRRLIQSSQDSAYARVLEGLAMLGLNEPAKTRKALERSIAKYPDEIRLQYLIGLVHLELSMPDAAFKAFSRVADSEAAPELDKADAHFHLGLFSWAEHRRAEALEHWKKAVELDPDHEEAAHMIETSTNDYGEPKAPSDAMDDFYHFINIQTREFLKTTGKDAFSTKEEAEKVLGTIREVWNARLTRSEADFDGMTPEEKTNLFSSIEITWPA